MKEHKPGIVAVFISCEDRAHLDSLREKAQKKAGYPLTLKAVLSRIIQEAK